jgi:hypothetical protein
MKASFVQDIAHDFAEALRANPRAARDVQELMDTMALSYGDLVSAQVPESDLAQLARLTSPMTGMRTQPAKKPPPV